ncbi:MAG: L,D-transpeptidase family protein, partial [Hyphomicrobiaceae bacterium]
SDTRTDRSTGCQPDGDGPAPRALVSRRTALRILGGSAAVAAATQSSTAQAQWWQNVFRDQKRAASSRSPRQSKPPDNLRQGHVPLHRDETIERLDRAIAYYRKVVDKGGWPKTKRLRLIRPGDDHEAIPAIRRQLVIMGDIPNKGAQYYSGSFHFDEWLVYGVKRFQKRHGLRVSGRLDRPTRAQLSVTADARLSQLMLNRRRIAALMEAASADRYVLVNVPGFQLEAVDRFEVHQRHRVIVGKPDRQTPEISATIKGLNFFPYWRVPDSVANLDLIPRLVREPDYLQKERIRVSKGYYDGPELNTNSIDWRTADAKQIKFRQDPGPWNALGLVRINMPNKEIVYMHDTPMKPLFKQRHRAFSAGCVRVENVFDLVSWISKHEPGLNSPGAINSILDQGNLAELRDKRPKEYDVQLTRPIPVQFTYVTAWVEDNGIIEFRPDIYGRDGASELVGDSDPDAPKPPVMLSP